MLLNYNSETDNLRVNTSDNLATVTHIATWSNFGLRSKQPIRSTLYTLRSFCPSNVQINTPRLNNTRQVSMNVAHVC